MNIFQRVFKILGIETDNEKIFELVENAKVKYLDVLKNIEIILQNGKLHGQANIIENIATNLINKDYPKFIKEINSINMWGGSGAVWEVDFQNENLQQKFHVNMLELINLMEETKILGNGIKPLKKLFKKELSK